VSVPHIQSSVTNIPEFDELDELDPDELNCDELDTEENELDPEALEANELDPDELDPDELNPDELEPDELDLDALDPDEVDPDRLDPDAEFNDFELAVTLPLFGFRESPGLQFFWFDCFFFNLLSTFINLFFNFLTRT
jgi:hypothetical protein